MDKSSHRRPRRPKQDVPHRPGQDDEQARARRLLEQTKADIADPTGVEREVRRAEARLPESAAELVTASTDFYGDGPFEEIRQYQSASPRIHDALVQLEIVLHEHLVDVESGNGESDTDANLSALVTGLMEAAARGVDAIHAQELAVISSEYKRLLFAVAPILRDIRDELERLEVEEVEAAMDISTARVDGLRVASLFGVAEQLNQQVPEAFPLLDLERVDELVAHIPVENPYADPQWWVAKSQVHNEIRGEKGEVPIQDVRELIVMRTELVQDVIDEKMDTLRERLLEVRRRNTQNPQEDEARMQEEREVQQLLYDYERLATWLEEQVEVIDSGSDMSADSFGFRMRNVHLLGDNARGARAGRDREREVVQMLNALERIKHDDPQLRMRMLGVMPGPDGSPVQSDMYGSLFQWAVYRSTEITKTMVVGQELAGSVSELRHRIAGIGELNRAQTPLTYVPSAAREQLAQIRDNSMEAVKADAEAGKPNMVAAVQMLLSEKYRLSAQMHEMLRAVDVEAYEARLTQLVEGTPNQFLYALIELEDSDMYDPRIMQIANERLIDREQEYVWDGHGSPVERFLFDAAQDPQQIYALLRTLRNDVIQYQEGKEQHGDYAPLPTLTPKIRLEIGRQLWKTVPDSEQLLTNEFKQFIEAIYKFQKYRHSEKGTNDSEWKQARKAFLHPVLTRHQDISANQWKAWFANMFAKPKPFFKVVVQREPAFHAVTRELFTGLDVLEILENPTQFYRGFPSLTTQAYSQLDHIASAIDVSTEAGNHGVTPAEAVVANMRIEGMPGRPSQFLMLQEVRNHAYVAEALDLMTVDEQREMVGAIVRDQWKVHGEVHTQTEFPEVGALARKIFEKGEELFEPGTREANCVARTQEEMTIMQQLAGRNNLYPLLVKPVAPELFQLYGELEITHRSTILESGELIVRPISIKAGKGPERFVPDESQGKEGKIYPKSNGFAEWLQRVLQEPKYRLRWKRRRLGSRNGEWIDPTSESSSSS